MNTPYESPLGQAIDLISRGFSLPFALRRELTEQGYDVPAMQVRYQPKN